MGKWCRAIRFVPYEDQNGKRHNTGCRSQHHVVLAFCDECSTGLKLLLPLLCHMLLPVSFLKLLRLPQWFLLRPFYYFFNVGEIDVDHWFLQQ
jgi:hypothetical protein